MKSPRFMTDRLKERVPLRCERCGGPHEVSVGTLLYSDREHLCDLCAKARGGEKTRENGGFVKRYPMDEAAK